MGSKNRFKNSVYERHFSRDQRITSENRVVSASFRDTQSRKSLPVRYCPTTIELELVNDPLSPIVSYLAGANFKAENTSTSWSVQSVQAKCDLVTLDNALDNSCGALTIWKSVTDQL